MRGAESERDFSSGTKTGVDPATGSELLKGILIPVSSEALTVRAMVSAKVGSLLPLDSEPSKIVHSGFRELRLTTRTVEIVVSKNEDASRLFCTSLRNEEGGGMP